MCNNVSNVEGEEALISVSKTYLGQITTKQEKIKVRPFVTDTAKVGIKVGRLLSLGNYENIRIEIFISSPAYVEEIVDVYKQVKNLATDLLDSEVAELTSQIGA
jgi:hypothetical protein